MFVHFPNISALDFDYVVKKYFFPDLEQYTEYCIAGMYNHVLLNRGQHRNWVSIIFWKSHFPKQPFPTEQRVDKN